MHHTAITIAGNLASDPTLRAVTETTNVLEMRVLVNRRVQRDGAWVDAEPTGFDVEVWGTAAENVHPHLRSGLRVLVTGHLETSTWTDQQGTAKYRTVLKAHEIGESLTTRRRPR